MSNMFTPNLELFGNPLKVGLGDVRHMFLTKAFASHPDIVSQASQDEFRMLCYTYECVRWLPVFLWTGEREVEIPNRVVEWDAYSLQDAFQTFGRTLTSGGDSFRPGDLVVPCRIELRDVLLGNFKTLRLSKDVCCTECNGEGRSLGGYCRSCGGKGTIRSEERVNFEIPPGSTSGNMQVIPGKGSYHQAQKAPGDLLVVFEEQLPPHLRRQGVDCHCEVEVDVTILALGGTASAENPSGEKVYFKVPPGTHSGRIVPIPGQGFPQYRTRSWGSLLCRMIPKLPSLDHGERELFMRLRELGVQRGGIQYRTQGRFGVLVIRPENDSPMIAEELVDLAVVLQTSGLVPAVDMTGLVPFAPRSVLNALVAVYNRCFQRGQMKVVAHPEVATALKSLQIGALFEVIVSAEELDGKPASATLNPFEMVTRGKWEVYPMGASALVCDVLLGNPDLLDSLEPQGHAFKAFDLSQIPQVDSFLIGKLIRVFKYCTSAGGEVLLIGVRPNVARVLIDTGLHGLFRQVKNVDELPD